jgi:hypothetical protein
MSQDDIKTIPINQLRQEDGASELAESLDMEPYLSFIVATMQGRDPRWTPKTGHTWTPENRPTR